MPETPEGKEAARLDRLPDVSTFLAFFRFVAEKGYERQTFESWAKGRA
jgi:hypothetical protein